MLRSLAIALTLALFSPPALSQSTQSLYWTDGDSGVLDGVKFRLADVDAAETGGVGSINGAKCEAERKLGFNAKEFMVEATRGKRVTITGRDQAADKYGREVYSLSVDGKDLAQLGIRAGHLKPYVFENARQTQKKPTWC